MNSTAIGALLSQTGRPDSFIHDVLMLADALDIPRLTVADMLMNREHVPLVNALIRRLPGNARREFAANLASLTGQARVATADASRTQDYNTLLNLILHPCSGGYGSDES